MSENEKLVERLRAPVHGESERHCFAIAMQERAEAATALTAAQARIKMLSEALAGVMPVTSYGPEGKSPPDELAAIAAGHAALAALESARSAEPVASDITEEEIARALVEFQFPGCGEDEATVASHLPMARAVLAIVHPALERARVEERERCLAIVNAQTPDWVKERSGPYWDGYREAMEDASDDIRKAP